MLDWLLGRLLPQKQLHDVQAVLKRMTPQEKALANTVLSNAAATLIKDVTAAIGDPVKAQAYVQGAVQAGKVLAEVSK